MFVRGIGTANPTQRYTKADCLAAFQNSEWYARLDARSHFVARTVLQRDNGIEARRLALASLDEVFAIDPNTRLISPRRQQCGHWIVQDWYLTRLTRS